MTVDVLLSDLECFVRAPNGIQELRGILMQLAIMGRLVEQEISDGHAKLLIEEINRKRESLIESKSFKKSPKFEKVEVKDVPFRIPDSWVWSTLSRLGQINPRNNVKDEMIDASFLPMAVISEKYDISPAPESKSWREIKKGFTHVANNDVAVAKITPCFENGKACVLRNLDNGVGAGTTELHVFRPLPDTLLPEFVYLFLKSPEFNFKGRGFMTGTAGQKRVSGEFFATTPFPVPPLEEQKRIVAKVDELMALCDQLETMQQQQANTLLKANTAAIHALLSSDNSKEDLTKNWQRIADNFHTLYGNALPMPPGKGRQKKYFVGLENLKQLRQMILQLAVMGKLSDYFEDEFDATNLLTKIDQIKKERKIKIVAKNRKPEIFFMAPKHWKWVQFEDLLIGSSSGWSPKCSGHQRKNGNWGVLKVSAVTWGVFKPEENKELPGGVIPRSEFEVKGDDFLLSRANTAELVAKSIVVGECESKLIMSDKIVRLNFYRDLNKKYLSIWNNSVYVRQYYIRHASGTSDSMRNVTRQIIHEVPIPLPPPEEQKRIVAKVDQLMAICDQLEQQLTTAYGDSEKLIDSTIRSLVA